MTKKQYFSRIIGSGTDDDMYRPHVDTYAVNWTAQIDCDPVTGIPLSVWALTTVECDDEMHAVLMADENMSLVEQ